jgi:uncharacterized membrane protein YphA (DoxX/SURF4 family)
MNATISKSIRVTHRESESDHLGGATEAITHSLSFSTTLTTLRFTFGLVPIVAGLDKFTNILVNWESYLNPLVLNLIPIGAHTFMGIVGVIEIVAGILVLARPRLGGFIVMAWLTCIALSLIADGKNLDVAVRDLVMAIGAFTLANLSAIGERSRATAPLD